MYINAKENKLRYVNAHKLHVTIAHLHVYPIYMYNTCINRTFLIRVVNPSCTTLETIIEAIAQSVIGDVMRFYSQHKSLSLHHSHSTKMSCMSSRTCVVPDSTTFKSVFFNITISLPGL